MTPSTDLDAMIDRYLRHESRQRPKLGYPSEASGTRLARPNRQWDSEHETLAESSLRAELAAMEGAMDSLDSAEYRAICVDAWNRTTRLAVFRVPGLSAVEMRDLVARAKSRLAALLSDRGVLL